jgi:hypothetical protein
MASRHGTKGGWTHASKQEHGSVTTDDRQVDADESRDGYQWFKLRWDIHPRT